MMDSANIVAIDMPESIRTLSNRHRADFSSILGSRHALYGVCLESKPDSSDQSDAAEDVFSCARCHRKTFLSIDLVQRRESLA